MTYDLSNATRGENRTDLIDWDALEIDHWYRSKPVGGSDPDSDCNGSNGPQSPQTLFVSYKDAQSTSEADLGCVIGPEVAEPTNEPCALAESLRQPQVEPDWMRDIDKEPEPHEWPYAWAFAMVAMLQTEGVICPDCPRRFTRSAAK